MIHDWQPAGATLPLSLYVYTCVSLHMCCPQHYQQYLEVIFIIDAGLWSRNLSTPLPLSVYSVLLPRIPLVLPGVNCKKFCTRCCSCLEGSRPHMRHA